MADFSSDSEVENSHVSPQKVLRYILPKKDVHMSGSTRSMSGSSMSGGSRTDPFTCTSDLFVKDLEVSSLTDPFCTTVDLRQQIGNTAQVTRTTSEQKGSESTSSVVNPSPNQILESMSDNLSGNKQTGSHLVSIVKSPRQVGIAANGPISVEVGSSPTGPSPRKIEMDRDNSKSHAIFALKLFRNFFRGRI